MIKAFKHETFYINIKPCRGHKMENKMPRRKKNDVKCPTRKDKLVLECLKIGYGGRSNPSGILYSIRII